MNTDTVKWHEKPELARLKDLSQPPKTLYYRGEWDAGLLREVVAIVGSRKITEYGKRVIEKIVPRLVLEGKTIISGFMYGVDQYAHRTCVEAGGKTIAVLGWGINYPLSASDATLAGEITTHGGLMLSEWEAQKPTLWTFPMRNRIVAALASEVIVVEAAVKSGSLITAEWGNKLKRTVWAVPGPVTGTMSAGTNWLIANGLAKMWLPEVKVTQLPLLAQNPVLSVLEREALAANELARKLNRPVAEVGAELTQLVLLGQVTEKEGKYYAN